MKTLNKVEKICNLDKKNLIERTLKASEEVGEISQAVLSYLGASGCQYKGKTKNDILEESIDVILVVASIITEINGGSLINDDVLNMFNSKLDKWSKRVFEESHKCNLKSI